MRKRRSIKGQGSLEYLIIIGAVIAVAAVVVLFTSGAFGSIGANVSGCKAAASSCAAKLATSQAPPCPMCDTGCVDSSGKDVMSKTTGCGGACILCKMGAANKIGGSPKILLFGASCGTVDQLRTSLNEKGFKYTDKITGATEVYPTDDEIKAHDIIINFKDCWGASPTGCTLLKNALSYGKAVMLIGNDNGPGACDLCAVGETYSTSCGVVSSVSSNHVILSGIPAGNPLANNGGDGVRAVLTANAQAVVLGNCANGMAAVAVRTDMKAVQMNTMGDINAALLSNAIYYLFG